jgi:hypothetical protein
MRLKTGAPANCILVLLLSGMPCVQAQPPAPVPQAAPSEADRASALFDQNNLVAALPLYEDLAAQDPASALYAERFAFCHARV